MSVSTRPGEEHLTYAPERFEDEREVEVWPAWDEAEEAE